MMRRRDLSGSVYERRQINLHFIIFAFLSYSLAHIIHEQPPKSLKDLFAERKSLKKLRM